jgi:hypothetical protein
MKFIFAILFITSAAFANAGVQISCQTEQNAGGLLIDTELGHLSYIYTTGRIICPASLEYLVNDKSDFRCVGLWDYVGNNEPLSVEFRHDGERYIATFKASAVHNNKKVRMICNQ